MERKIFSFELTNLDAEGRTFEGYAATFGNIDLTDDIIHPGAFTKTLAERGGKVKLLWQHDTSEPIGRPVEMREDARGLYIKAIISDTARGRDALALLKDKALYDMSIGYDTLGEDFGRLPDGKTVRNLREIRLWEVSLVTFPANEGAVVTGLKAMDFASTLADMQQTEVASERYQAVERAFRATLSAIVGDETISTDAKVGLAARCFDQYRDAMLSWLQSSMMFPMVNEALSRDFELELKAGARHSGNDTKLLNSIHDATVALGATNCKGLVGEGDDADGDNTEAKSAVMDGQAGPEPPPTCVDLLALIEIEDAELELLEI